MTLEELKNKINPLIGVKFGAIYEKSRLDTILVNKGQAGQILEISSGLISQ